MTELENLQAYLKLFNRFTHVWRRRGKTEAQPACDPGLVYRDKKNVPLLNFNDHDPSCPNCRQQIGLPPRTP